MDSASLPERADTGGIAQGPEGVSLLDLIKLLRGQWKALLAWPLAFGLVALGITYIIAPTFTARTKFLPPQQAQNSIASALSSLGALSGLAGAIPAARSPEQYVALMQSELVQNHLIDEFKLMEVYEADYRVDARDELARNVRISVGKRDGLITIEVDDKSPQRAAAMANRHVDELRQLMVSLALTEAQQRRVFFEAKLKEARHRLTEAEQALQGSGFNAGALRAEPKAAAEGYARLKAEATAAEVRLQVLRRGLADSAPEVQQQLSALSALRSELARMEAKSQPEATPGYIAAYREFKYQETLFELFARQFELARVDESREGTLVQVVDVAVPPEKKSRPRRAVTAVATTLVSGVLLALLLVVRHYWREAAAREGRRRRTSADAPTRRDGPA